MRFEFIELILGMVQSESILGSFSFFFFFHHVKLLNASPLFAPIQY